MFGSTKFIGLGGVGEHDRAPEATSEVDPGGDFLGGGVEAAGDVEVKGAVVVKVSKLSAKGPAGAGFAGVGFGDLVESSVRVLV